MGSNEVRRFRRGAAGTANVWRIIIIIRKANSPLYPESVPKYTQVTSLLPSNLKPTVSKMAELLTETIYGGKYVAVGNVSVD